jgi:hypothetical protein
MTEHEIPSAILPAPRKAWIHRATSGEHDSAYLGEELPEALARLDGADNRVLEGVAHVDMVDSPAVWRALQDALRADDPAAPGPYGPASQ